MELEKEKIELEINKKNTSLNHLIKREEILKEKIILLNKNYDRLSQKWLKTNSELKTRKALISELEKRIKEITMDKDITLDERELLSRLIAVLSRVKKIKEKNDSELLTDVTLDKILSAFVEKTNTFVLVFPTVIDHLIYFIHREKNSDIQSEDIREVYYLDVTSSDLYMGQKSEARKLYNNSISILFSLLAQKGYQISGNEKRYLHAIKEKTLQNIYEEEKDEFYLLEQNEGKTLTLQDVILLYIKSLNNEGIYKLRNIIFLNHYLGLNGSLNCPMDYDSLKKHIGKESVNYKITRLEEELMGTMSKCKDSKIIFEDIHIMDGRDFEFFIVTLLNNLGFKATITKASGDQGVDIIARKNGKKFAVQTKRYTSSVGNKAIQEVVSGMYYYGADISMVITNSAFTSAAKKLAEKTNTILWDGQKLKNMIDVGNM